jgi:predicted Zn-dependent protease
MPDQMMLQIHESIGHPLELDRILGDERNFAGTSFVNYRAISAQFWKSLSAVGDASTFKVLGTPNCGKGEPNQVIRVGHASPACVFSNVDVFGGDA